MIPVIFDCDNTMGLPFKDVDDGLALLYLLGSDNIDLKAVTTTFGNSTIEDVYPNTQRIFKELNLVDTPLYLGASSKHNRNSEAAEALVKLVNDHPNELTILATGSMTNLHGAYEQDANFFNKVKQVVMMGGIEYPLLVNGKPMNELNFSCDSEAIATVLTHGKNLSIITGHVCLEAIFNYDTYDSMHKKMESHIYDFIVKETKGWISFIGQRYEMNGFCNWDAVAAVYIDHPELFRTNTKKIGAQLEDLETGLLKINNTIGNAVKIPESIINVEELNNKLIDNWAKL